MIHRMGRLLRQHPGKAEPGLYYVGTDLTHSLPPNYGRWGSGSTLTARLLAAGNGVFSEDQNVEIFPSQEIEIEVDEDTDEEAEEEAIDDMLEPRKKQRKPPPRVWERRPPIKVISTPLYIVRDVRGEGVEVKSTPLANIVKVEREETYRLKQELLALPSDAPIPEHRTRLRNAYDHFTNPRHISYDAELTKTLAERHPLWKQDSRVKVRFEKLMSFPADAPRPSDRTLSRWINIYCTKSSPSYRAFIDKALKGKYPHWFRGVIDWRAELLALPPGSPRPPRSTKLGGALNRLYSRDQEFREAIRQKQPHWFKAPRGA
jgi:hypothetical protein